MSFKSFFDKLNHDSVFDYVFEAREDVLFNVGIPTPQSVINLLNVIGAVVNSEPDQILNVKAQALEWIYKEGARKACINRKKFAEQRGIPQQAVFSVEAHQELGLNTQQIEQEWFQGNNEPDTIVVEVKGERHFYSIANINQVLKGMDLSLFHFGGQDGLIEYLEIGNWNTKERRQLVKWGRHGVDMTMPKGSNGLGQNESGKLMYTWGEHNGYTPPVSYKNYNQAVRKAARLSKQFYESIWRTPESQRTPEQQAILSRLQRRMEPSTHIKNLPFVGQESVSSRIPIPSPELYEKFKKALRYKFEQLWDQPMPNGFQRHERHGNKYIATIPRIVFDGQGQRKEQEIDQLMNFIFDDRSQTMRAVVEFNWDKLPTRSNKRLNVKILLRDALKELGDLNARYPEFYGNKSVLASPEHELADITPEELEKQGYQAVGGPNDAPINRSPDDTSLRMKRPGDFQVRHLVRTRDGWKEVVAPSSMKNVDLDQRNPHPLAPGRMKLKFNTGKVGARKKIATPEGMRKAVWTQLMSHPEEYGDEIVSNPRSRSYGYPESIAKGVETTGVTGSDFSDAMQQTVESLLKHVNSLYFRWGNPNFIAQNMAKAPIVQKYGDQGQAIIKKWGLRIQSHVQKLFSQHQGQGDPVVLAKNPDRLPDKTNGLYDPNGNEVHPFIYQALLNNGFEWRKAQARDAVRTWKNQQGKGRGVRAGSLAGRNMEGEDQSIDPSETGYSTGGGKEHIKVGGLEGVEEFGGPALRARNLSKKPRYYAEYQRVSKVFNMIGAAMAPSDAIRAILHESSPAKEEKLLGRVDAILDYMNAVYPQTSDKEQEQLQDYNLHSVLRKMEQEGGGKGVVHHVVLKLGSNEVKPTNVSDTAQFTGFSQPQQSQGEVLPPARAVQTPAQPAATPAATPAKPQMSDLIASLKVKTGPTPTQPQEPESVPLRGANMRRDMSSMIKNLKLGRQAESRWHHFKQIMETDAVYDGTKPKTGCGFNWWGAVGKAGGTEIGGEVETANEDPDGTKNTKKRRKSR